MDTTAILVESACVFGKHIGGRDLDPSGAAMFSRIFDLTVRATLARDPERWDGPEGRAYALIAAAQIAREATRLAGDRGPITGAILRQAADKIIDDARHKFGIPTPPPMVTSPFCFCYVIDGGPDS